jgi:polysaccharide biosynthesis transport protein
MNAGFRIPTNNERRIDLRQYLNFVWRNWMFIVSVTALILLIGAIYLMRATPLYTASTQVLLEHHERAPGLDAAGNDFRVDDPSYVDDQLAILQSDSLLRRVAIKELAPIPKETEGLSQNKDDPPSDRAITDGINRLRGALAVARSGYTQILYITITWDDPVRAGELANAVADAYVVDQLDARLEAAKRASGWLSDRITELRQQLRDSEEAVAKFRKEHGLTRSGPTVALNEQQLAELNGKLIAARTDAAEKKARVGASSWSTT